MCCREGKQMYPEIKTELPPFPHSLISWFHVGRIWLWCVIQSTSGPGLTCLLRNLSQKICIRLLYLLCKSGILLDLLKINFKLMTFLLFKVYGMLCVCICCLHMYGCICVPKEAWSWHWIFFSIFLHFIYWYSCWPQSLLFPVGLASQLASRMSMFISRKLGKQMGHHAWSVFVWVLGFWTLFFRPAQLLSTELSPQPILHLEQVSAFNKCLRTNWKDRRAKQKSKQWLVFSQSS